MRSRRLSVLMVFPSAFSTSRPRGAVALTLFAFTALLAAPACHTSPAHQDADRDSAVDIAPAPSGASDAGLVPVDGAASSVDVGESADTTEDAGAMLGTLCFPPLPGGIDPCPKGAMAGQAGLERCRGQHAETKPETAFRVGSSVSSRFSPSSWRCVRVPLGRKEHVSMGSIGVDVTVPATCDSHTMDMQGPNFYGAVFFRCSTRRRAHDELVEANAAP